jgi:hypothetical protein
MKTTHAQFGVMTALSLALSLLNPISAQAAAGDLDPAFGHAGLAQTDFANTDEYGFAARIQSDGKIVVGGPSGVYPVFHAALIRY